MSYLIFFFSPKLCNRVYIIIKIRKTSNWMGQKVDSIPTKPSLVDKRIKVERQLIGDWRYDQPWRQNQEIKMPVNGEVNQLTEAASIFFSLLKTLLFGPISIYHA